MDTFPDLFGSALDVLRAEGSLDEAAWRDPGAGEEVRHLTGAGSAAILAAAAPERPVDEALVRRMVARYAERIVAASRPFPGTDAWLRRWPAAVTTNKPDSLAVALLRGLYGDQAPMVVGPERAGAPKPDPAMLHVALAELDVSADRAWLVGDDPRDQDAAEAAGVPFVCAAWGYTRLADWPPGRLDGVPVLETPSELMRLAGEDG